MKKFFVLTVLVVMLFIGCGKGEMTQPKTQATPISNPQVIELGEFLVPHTSVVDATINEMSDLYDIPKFDPAKSDPKVVELWGDNAWEEKYLEIYSERHKKVTGMNFTSAQQRVLSEEIIPRFKWMFEKRYMEAGMPSSDGPWFDQFESDIRRISKEATAKMLSAR
jgi:hypothetical protein